MQVLRYLDVENSLDVRVHLRLQPLKPRAGGLGPLRARIVAFHECANRLGPELVDARGLVGRDEAACVSEEPAQFRTDAATIDAVPERAVQSVRELVGDRHARLRA